jgi:hypothetical protein
MGRGTEMGWLARRAVGSICGREGGEGGSEEGGAGGETDFPLEMRSPKEDGRRNSFALVALAAGCEWERPRGEGRLTDWLRRGEVRWLHPKRLLQREEVGVALLLVATVDRRRVLVEI